MDDGGGSRAKIREDVDVRHDVVASVLLFVCGSLEVDVVDVCLQLGYLGVGYGTTQFL